MNLRALLLGALFAALGALALPSYAEQPVPRLTARVTDLTATLDGAQRQALEQKLAAIETKRGSQVAVLLVPTTEPETIEQYGIRVADAWKLGRKGVDDGVLVLVAKNDRALRIEVGRGLEGAIPDAIAKRIIAEVITPPFRAGDFAGGLNAGVDALSKVIDGEQLPPPAVRSSAQQGRTLESVAITLLAFVIIGGAILRSIFGRVLGATLVGGIAGVAAWVLLGSLFFGIVGAIIAFVLVLTNGNSMMSSGGGWGGGGGGSWGGGSSSGGFSGGGGGFGGGGASGKW